MRVYIANELYFEVDPKKLIPGRLAEILVKELYKSPSRRKRKGKS